MPQMTVNLNSAKLKELVFQLPPAEFLALAADIEERAETLTMMRLAESGFREWDEAGEDIYDVG